MGPTETGSERSPVPWGAAKSNLMAGYPSPVGKRPWYPLLVAAATRTEARLFPRNDVAVHLVQTGPGSERAAQVARLSAPTQHSGLLSFGFAGGLDPALRPGTIVLPERVRQRTGEVCLVDAAWHAQVVAALRADWSGAELQTADVVVEDSLSKTRMHAATGAGSVDLESGALAYAAADLQLPFLVFRIILDGSDDDLPVGVASLLTATGAARPAAAMLALARHPFAFAQLLLRYRAASITLRHTLCRIWPALLNPPSRNDGNKDGGTRLAQAK